MPEKFETCSRSERSDKTGLALPEPDHAFAFGHIALSGTFDRSGSASATEVDEEKLI